jgi:hypothetical protein
MPSHRLAERRTVRLLSPLLLLLLLHADTAWARPTLPAAELAALDRGQVLEYSRKVSGSNVMAGKAVLVFDDNPEAVAWVLLALDKYKAFVPRVNDSRIVKRHGYDTFAVVETSLPWPAKDCWAYLKYTRRDKPGRTFEITWSMLNGNMKNYTGQALVEPWNKEGTRTVLTYEMLFEPITAAPDSVVSRGVRTAASLVAQKLRLRLLALRKFGKMPKGF